MNYSLFAKSKIPKRPSRFTEHYVTKTKTNDYILDNYISSSMDTENR